MARKPVSNTKQPIYSGGFVDENGKVIQTTGHMHAGAVELAKYISDDLQNDLFVTWEAVKTGKLSTLVIKADIEASYTAEQIIIFPVPNSVQKADEKGSPVSANNPAKFTFWNERTKKDETGDFYEDFIASMPRGAEAKLRLKYLEDSKLDAPTTKEGAAFKALGDNKVISLITDIKAEFNAYQNTVMKAIRFIIQERAFNETLADTLAFEVMTDDDGNYLTANKPIIVGEAKKLGKSDVFSVTSFLNFDVAECKKNGGTFDALLKTLEREPLTPTTFSVKDFKTMEVALSELASYLETIAGDEKLEKALFNYLNKPGNGAMVSAMFKVNAALDDFTVKPDLQKINNAVAA